MHKNNLWRKLLKGMAVLFFISCSVLTTWAEEDSEPNSQSVADRGWPRLTTSEAGSKILMHLPQVESWDGQKKIVAWAAVEYLASGRTNSEMGVVKYEAQTSVAIQERLVRFENIQIKQVNFPTLDQARAKEVTTVLIGRLPKESTVVPLDRILSAVDKSSLRLTGIAVNQEPPPIFYSKRPAVLVQFDGEPIMSPIKDSSLKFAVNTNWDVLFDPDTKLFYLRNNKNWFSSKEELKVWTPLKKLPKSFETIPAEANWAEVRANMPPKRIDKSDAPLIFVSKQPAELIVTDGKPKLQRVEKSKLYWIQNTECDLFQMKRGPYYFLVSGRWFRANKLEGPWVFSSPDLPKEFLSIPRTHPRARVRASIPGTDEATEAVLLAQIPRTLHVSKENLQSPQVKYDGEPKFKEIKGTKVSYAINCINDVLKVGDKYLLCFQGAWFESRRTEGPWTLAASVPDEIYKIPSDSPMYHVTYVTVEKATPTEVVYAQTAGYSGVTVSFGVAMWGTGWYYPPYYYYGGYYPCYYPYPYSYGSYAVYNSRTGAYGYGSTVSGPNGGISHVATYNPNTGTYARGTVAYGDSGVRAHGEAYNPRTGTSMETRQGKNEQGSWGTTKVQRGDDWAQSAHVKNEQGSVSGIKTSEGSGAVRASGENGSGFVAKNGDDVYAGKDGNVYRKTEDGWQQHTEGGWSDVNGAEPKISTNDQKTERGLADKSGASPSTGTRDQLNRDAGARDQGNQRVQQSNNYDRGSGASSRGTGSYGGGGGAGRSGGGGGRRR